MATQPRVRASLKRNSVLKCPLLSAEEGEEKEAVVITKGQVLNPIE